MYNNYISFMEKDNFIKNKIIRDEKTFKKRKIINGITTAAIFVSCVAIGVAIPLLIPVIGGALATSGILALAGTGIVLNGIGAAMATFGIAEACLIGGAIGAAIGGVGSFIRHKCVDYSIIKDENKSFKENILLTEPLKKEPLKKEPLEEEPLEKESSKKEPLEKVANNKNQVEVSSPQEVNKNVEKGNELAR